MGSLSVLVGVLKVSNSRLLAVIMLCPILETTFDYFCEIFLKKLIVLLLVSSVTIFASAANWVESGSVPDEGVYTYVDTESISKQGNYKQAFTKIIENSKERMVIALRTYDCRSNPIRLKNTYIAAYDLEGNITMSGPITNNDFSPVIPGTLGVKTADIICNL